MNDLEDIINYLKRFLNMTATIASPSIAGQGEYPVSRAFFTM
jgi:hypothetical protein